jgi:hypothetical protein
MTVVRASSFDKLRMRKLSMRKVLHGIHHNNNPHPELVEG